MLLLKKNTFEVSSDASVVEAGDAAVLVRAEEIVAAAEADAAKTAEEARAAYEEEKKKGYTDGVAEGKTEIMMQKLDLIEESVRYMESIETKVADLVMKALRKCVAEIGDKELVCQIVKKAMQVVVRNQRQITIKVAPDSVAAVKERLQAILADFPSLTYADVKEDQNLTATACVVETDAGIVEASIEAQLDAIEKSIRKNFSKEG